MTLVAGLGIDDLLALRDLDRAAVRDRFGERKTAAGVAYEGLAGVDRLDTEHPRMHFFFRGEEQVMLYVPRKALADADPDAVQAELGKPEATLRSRAGRGSRILLWPQRGVALSTDGETAEILEVFAPTTVDGYKAEIYQDPGSFTR